jgi:predicted ATPase/DNA-binding XRE family transcriptional regulator
MSADHISPFVPTFGLLLRRYRMAAGLTQEQLAARAGLSVRGISDLERGRKRTPHHETVALLTAALSLPPHKRAQLEAAARPNAPASLALSDVLTPPNNLPAALTPLIGRERETLAATKSLARSDLRALTLTGPGGVGKTRLALEIAGEMLPQFEDGVFLVLLAPLRDPALVLATIAETVDMRVGVGEPLPAQLRTYLRGRQVLLLLDNFEHLLPAAGDVSGLLASCPRLSVLVTSREPLHIDGEHEMPVSPLAPEAAADLFLRRARAVNPTLQAAPHDFEVIEEICGRVDRLPLGIELAAVWAKVLPLPELLARLSSRLDLLSTGRRDAPERQRTLRDTIAWSERLLEPEESRLFHRLAIFAGGFSAAEAEAICGEDFPRGAVLSLLASLTEKSLLRVDTRRDEPRFLMLETIREFALERLRESGKAEPLARRHAEFYAELTTRMAWVGQEQASRDRRLELALPNIRAALEWAFARSEALLAIRLTAGLGRFWMSCGAVEEGERWLRWARTLQLAPGEDVPRLRVLVLFFLILFALDRHDFEEAEALAREGLDLAKRTGDQGGAANMLAELGHVAEARGDLNGARALFEQSLAQLRSAGNRGNGLEFGAVGRVLSSLGNVARAQGDFERARAYLEESLAWARERQFPWAIASGEVSLGHLACEVADMTGAASRYREALELYRNMPNPAAIAWCLEGVAICAAHRGDHAHVAWLCGAIATLQQSAGIRSGPEWSPYSFAVHAARQALGENAFTVEQAKAAGLTLDHIISRALRISR